MSDTDTSRFGSQGPDYLAFVSGNGHIIGVSLPKHGSEQPKEGMAVAILRRPTTLVDWLDMLHDSLSLEHAVNRMLDRCDGEKVARRMDLTKATFVPFMGNVVGEA